MRALRSYLLIFVLFAAPTMVITWITLSIARESAGDDVALGLLGGITCGALVTIVLGALDLLGDRGRRPGERHGPRQEATVSVQGGSDLSDRIQAALRQLNAELREADISAGRYVARTRRSWRSWGEDVCVQLNGDPIAPVAHITSNPVVRTTLIDYGQGRRNVQQIATALRA